MLSPKFYFFQYNTEEKNGQEKKALSLQNRFSVLQ